MNSDTLVGSSPLQDIECSRSTRSDKLSLQNVKHTPLSVGSKTSFKPPNANRSDTKAVRRHLVLTSLKSKTTTRIVKFGSPSLEIKSFKSEVRITLNPFLRFSHNILLAAPMQWYDFFSGNDINPETPISTLQTLKRIVQPHIFPHLSPSKSIKTIDTTRIASISKSLALWIQLYSLPNLLQNPPTVTYFEEENKLNHIRNLIFSVLTASKITYIPFLLIISYVPVSMSKVRNVHMKIKHKLKLRKESSGTEKPLFTLHLQDMQNPYFLLWLDEENICTFNLQQLQTAASRANFALTVFQFIAYAESNSTADTADT